MKNFIIKAINILKLKDDWKIKIYLIKLHVALTFKKTGTKIKVADRNGRTKKVDLMDIRPGMFIKNFEGTILEIRGYLMEDEIDYLVPCSDGIAYSPLLLCNW